MRCWVDTAAVVVLICSGCSSDHSGGSGASGNGGALGASGFAGAAGSSVAHGGASAGGANAGAGGSSSGAAGSSAGSGGTNAGSGGASADAGAGGAADPCDSALFCERFDGYAAVTSIKDGQKFGPWHAALQTGATMGLDGTHKISGNSALHVHIDNAVTAGGRLFSDGAQPIFASQPTHVYGRMKLYIDPNGTSIHWTFFGVNGNAEASSPVVGRNASYILSSLPKNNVNTYSFVYGLAAKDADGFHDCSSQSNTAMPSDWACIAFDLDSVSRKLRMYKDAASAPILSIDDHGTACVAPTDVVSPWYGPAITQLYVGAWSFHQMNAPLDVWIDDLVVDTKPVSCGP